MSRAVFLPTPIDPYVDLLWLEVAKNTWFGEVDKVYILLNGDTEKKVAEYIKQQFELEDKVIVEYIPGMIQHGTSLALMTKKAEEDLVMFIEDDGFIFKKGLVEEMFEKIEEGECDLVGSPRMSASMDIHRVAARRFNVDLSGVGDVGCAFWPNFLFVKREDLLKTDLDFNAKGWLKGTRIKELDWIVEPDDPNADMVRSDTFVWGSLQLRALGLRCLHVPQYHLHPHWESEKESKVNIWDGKAGWLHAGSLSGSIYGVLTDQNGNGLAFRDLGLPPKEAGWELPNYVTTENEKREFEKRCAFYILGLERSDGIPELMDFRTAYFAAVERLIEKYSLDKGRIYGLKDEIERIFRANGALT